MRKNISNARRQGKIKLTSIILIVIGILCLTGSFSLRQYDTAGSPRQHDLAETQADDTLSETTTYIAALHDAAEKLLHELKESNLQKDAPKIAMWMIGNDIDHYLHNALVEHIKKDATFDIMDRASVTRIEGPASYEDLLIELAEKHGVKAILTGTILEKHTKKDRSRVLVSFSVRRVPDDGLIRQYSAIEGASPLPAPKASPRRPTRSLPSKLPNVLIGLSTLLIVSGIIMLAIPGRVARESNQCAILLSLLDEILPLNSDVMMLARQNGMHQIADSLIEAGAFFKQEQAHVKQIDYSAPGISRDLELLPEETTEVTGIDANISAEVRKCTAVLKHMYDSLTKADSSNHGILAQIEELYGEFQELTDGVRETFRERRTLLDKNF